MNVLQILASLSAMNASVYIVKPRSWYASDAADWTVTLEYQDPETEDKIEVKRRNTDFEAAFYAAWDAFQKASKNGISIPLLAGPSDLERRMDIEAIEGSLLTKEDEYR